jgi:hypothetical protein
MAAFPRVHKDIHRKLCGELAAILRIEPERMSAGKLGRLRPHLEGGLPPLRLGHRHSSLPCDGADVALAEGTVGVLEETVMAERAVRWHAVILVSLSEYNPPPFSGSQLIRQIEPNICSKSCVRFASQLGRGLECVALEP